MTIDFNSILNKKVDDAEKPKPLPMGSYVWNIQRHEFGASKQKKTPQVTFFVKPISVLDDVDQAALPDNWKDKERRVTFYLTEDSLYRLGDFLGHCGLNVSGRLFSAVIPETTNMQFVGNVTHEESNGNTYDNISSTAQVQ